MRLPLLGAALGLALAGCSGSGAATEPASARPDTTAMVSMPAPERPPMRAPAPAAPEFSVPVDYYTLDNGLKVVLSVDRSAPTASVAVYYNIGFRIEPRERTGFAHLFEHMMFQGSENLGKNEFIGLVQRNGGVLNGSTRFDFTNYYEIVPAHTLETMLWAEADRMRGLDVTQENLTNQQGVVSNEVRVNVINQPYGGFPWLDLPQLANENWYNAHNFYGELSDLEAATLEDVQAFFDTYYAPNNAALVVVGDIDVDQTKAWIEQYFGGIEAADVPPIPDLSEPVQTAEKRSTKVDSLAQRPALAWAYHAPERLSELHVGLAVLDQILLQGNDSRLHQRLVQEAGVTSGVTGGVNWPLGNLLNYNGPMLYSAWLIHDAETAPDSILAMIDEEIARIVEEGVTEADVARAKVKLKSALYDTIGGSYGIGRADLLATFALFDDDPDLINEIVPMIEDVTAETVHRAARETLRPENRSIITLTTPGS